MAGVLTFFTALPVLFSDDDFIALLSTSAGRAADSTAFGFPGVRAAVLLGLTALEQVSVASTKLHKGDLHL